MFSVRGWSISSNQPKLQTGRLAEYEQATVPKNQHSGANPKRRRSLKEQGTNIVTPDNLVEHWQRHLGKTSWNSGTNSSEKAKILNGTVNQWDPICAVAVQNRLNSKETKRSPARVTNEQRAKRKVLKDKGNKYKKRVKLQQPESLEGVEQSQSKALAELLSRGSLGLAEIAQMSKTLISNPASSPTLTPLQIAMRQKLISARFRYLNQILYTTPSASSSDLFRTNPSFFTEYHEGFQRQIGTWPENPVLAFVSWILDRSTDAKKVKSGHLEMDRQKSSFKKSVARGDGSPPHSSLLPIIHKPHTQVDTLPRNRRSNLCTIADLGCGSAILARKLAPMLQPLHLEIHSFDLYAPDPLITAADISKVPLPDSSVDVAISCLALMGTNWLDFVEEAYRLLRWKGEYWIAEVASRFVMDDSAAKVELRNTERNKEEALRVGKKNKKRRLYDEKQIQGCPFSDEEFSLSTQKRSKVDVLKNLDPFITVLRTRGFQLLERPEIGNKMFVRMRFAKGLMPTRGKGTPSAGQAQKQAFQRKRILEKGADKEGSIIIEDETKVLKPCVYKNR